VAKSRQPQFAASSLDDSVRIIKTIATDCYWNQVTDVAPKLHTAIQGVSGFDVRWAPWTYSVTTKPLRLPQDLKKDYARNDCFEQDESMLRMGRLEEEVMESDPFEWKFIDELFTGEDAAALAASFPRDKFKTVKGYDGEKSYVYVSRSLIHMGANTPSHPDGLSTAWREFARDLLSPEYLAAMTGLTGRDLSSSLMEVNVIHYGPGAWLGPHVDLKEKIATHVFYFNETWD
jgi:hypothetical protein